MPRRPFAAIGLALALALVPAIWSDVKAQAPRAAAKPAAVPRADNGKPDLTGIWSFATITPLQRPANLGDKTVLTDEEAANLEKQAAASANQDDGRQRGTAADVSRAYNDFWYDRGTRVTGTRQTSIIVDPPNGRIPAMTAEGQARAAARQEARRGRGPSDGPEDRSLAERCLIGFNAGPPFLPSAYNNNIQIVLTRDYVVIVNEMVHEARIVPLDGRPRQSQNIRPWMGESRGRWEGDTLVIETINFSPKNTPRGGSDKLKLTEKFTRTAADVVTYEFTFNDPATWATPWTGRMPLEKIDEIYEYACHEGNRGMEGIMKGTRTEQKDASSRR